MELVVRVQTQETLTNALEAGAAAVAAPLSRGLDSQGWSRLKDWQAAARGRGCRFYIIWDWLPGERDLPKAGEILASVAELSPDALVLRDLGVSQEARRRYHQLPLHASGNWGALTSPGIRLAETLGFSRVVLESPLSLRDLALMRRQTSLPLESVLFPLCRGFPGLCLLEEYLGLECSSCCGYSAGGTSPQALLASLELVSGYCQLGLDAVQIRGEFFPGASLAQVAELLPMVCEASPLERPRVLGAARQVLTAFADRFQGEIRAKPEVPPPALPSASATRRQAVPLQPQPGFFPGRGTVWLETRGYAEAVALARDWRGPLLIQLTDDNYTAFLREHHRWEPQRLIWRLPPLIRESALAFYQKALDTLRQGGYSRFVAGDWGAVALARAAGAEVYGDQTLGVRNSWALKAARRLGVTRVCLPPGPGPEAWQELVNAAPTGSFWSYLYHSPALAVFPRAAPNLPFQDREDFKRIFHWVPEEDAVLLVKKVPEHLESSGAWFKRQGVAPLVVSLPRSGLTWGRLPAGLAPPPQPRGRSRT